jgi:acyl phosphate:glycerol-3-phosphate acyltransferase
MAAFVATPVGAALPIVAAYLLGSLSFAVIVTRVMGQADPRTYGSKNPGATNVLRSGNKTAAVLTLLLDAAKGWLAVVVAQQAGAPQWVVAAVAVSVFLGHLYPVFFRFEGGKGVATALGVIVAINPLLGLATLATWLIIAFFFRYSSLASLISAVFAPFTYVLWFGRDALALAVLAMSALLVWRHRQNIANLIAGKESRLGQKKG